MTTEIFVGLLAAVGLLIYPDRRVVAAGTLLKGAL